MLLIPIPSLQLAIAQPVPSIVQVWTTKIDADGDIAGLQPQPTLPFKATRHPTNPVIQVDATKTYQPFEGAGASLTDSAAWLIHDRLNPEQRNTVMQHLFDPRQGIGISFLRNPMGASDITRSYYTYNDHLADADPDDPSLSNFSIDPDRANILPLTQQARRLNPSLTLMMTAWSPPAWMKTNQNLIGGGIQPQYYAHHANYYVKTIQAYAAEGIHIDYVSLNNEPTCCASPPIDYPSVWQMTPSDMATLLKRYWFPAFAANHLTTKILLLDFNWDNQDLVLPLLQDPEIMRSPYIGGIAWHGYGGDVSVQTRIQEEYGVPQYVTEHSGRQISPQEQMQRDFQDIEKIFRNWGRSYVKWSLALDETNGPRLGGCPNCTGLITIHNHDRQAGQVDYNIDYYTIGHLTKFVTKGAHRIDSTQNPQIWNVAFQNPDGSVALIAYNSDLASTRAFQVQWGQQFFDYTLPAGSAATFTWRKN